MYAQHGKSSPPGCSTQHTAGQEWGARYGSESLQLADDLVAFRKKLLRHWSGQKHVILTSFVASNPDQQNGGESAAADQGL